MNEYLKMSDVFYPPLKVDVKRVDFCVISDACGAVIGGFGGDRVMSEYASHAINHHDELVDEVVRLRQLVARMKNMVLLSGSFAEDGSNNPVNQWLFDIE